MCGWRDARCPGCAARAALPGRLAPLHSAPGGSAQLQTRAWCGAVWCTAGAAPLPARPALTRCTPCPPAPGAYLASLRKSLAKLLAEGQHSLVVVDAPNERTADIKEAWTAGQVGGEGTAQAARVFWGAAHSRAAAIAGLAGPAGAVQQQRGGSGPARGLLAAGACQLRARPGGDACPPAFPQQHGYEVYVVHAPESDPATCHARNIHGRSLEDVQKAAAAWEPLPPVFTQLDVKALLREAAGGCRCC